MAKIRRVRDKRGTVRCIDTETNLFTKCPGGKGKKATTTKTKKAKKAKTKVKVKGPKGCSSCSAVVAPRRRAVKRTTKAKKPVKRRMSMSEWEAELSSQSGPASNFPYRPRRTARPKKLKTRTTKRRTYAMEDAAYAGGSMAEAGVSNPRAFSGVKFAPVKKIPRTWSKEPWSAAPTWDPEQPVFATIG